MCWRLSLPLVGTLDSGASLSSSIGICVWICVYQLPVLDIFPVSEMPWGEQTFHTLSSPQCLFLSSDSKQESSSTSHSADENCPLAFETTSFGHLFQWRKPDRHRQKTPWRIFTEVSRVQALGQTSKTQLQRMIWKISNLAAFLF